MMAADLVRGLSYRLWRQGNLIPEFEIKDVVTSAESASKNTVFVHTKTALRDNHYEMQAAYQQGCRMFVTDREPLLPGMAAVLMVEDAEALLGVLAARCNGHPSRRMAVFGVAGGSGKSSTTLMVAEILRKSGKTVAVLTDEGTDDDGGFVPVGSVAPDAAALQRFLCRAYRQGARVAVLELSDYMLRHKAANGVEFSGILLLDTANGGDHDGKRHSLCRHVEPLLGEHTVLAYPATWRETPAAARRISYGAGGNVRMLSAVSALQEGKWQTALHLELKGNVLACITPCVGSFHAANAMAATALLHAAGTHADVIAKGLATAQPRGRLEPLYTPNGTIYFDFAYTGAALERVLSELRNVTKSRLFVLLGSVGGRARERRAALGAAAGTADHVYFTSDDPDGECPEAILQDLLADFPRQGSYTYLPDRAAALGLAVSHLRKGDTLLILGKAMEETQLICGERKPFSDRAVVAEALAEAPLPVP